jgi:hypothetical protein
MILIASPAQQAQRMPVKQIWAEAIAFSAKSAHQSQRRLIALHHR